MLNNIRGDLKFLKKKYGVSFGMSILSNRGFHALFFYRMSNFLWKNNIPIIPLILSRLIHVIYAIDIDFKAKIDGGVILIHGVGVVIGSGAVIHSGVIIYHQVTLGIKGSGINDGFPVIHKNVVLGAGSKMFGKITIGESSIVGANIVLTEDLEQNTLLKINNLGAYIKKELL
jgi:serine O-acetyltransferase